MWLHDPESSDEDLCTDDHAMHSDRHRSGFCWRGDKVALCKEPAVLLQWQKHTKHLFVLTTSGQQQETFFDFNFKKILLHLSG